MAETTAHVSTYAPTDLANSFTLAARREGLSTSAALRAAMRGFVVDVAQKDESRAGGRGSVEDPRAQVASRVGG